MKEEPPVIYAGECQFNHIDTSGVALPQQAQTRLNGAPPHISLYIHRSACRVNGEEPTPFKGPPTFRTP